MKIRKRGSFGRIVAILTGLFLVPPAMWILLHRLRSYFEDAGVFAGEGWFGTFVNANNLIYVIPGMLLLWWIVKAVVWAMVAAVAFAQERSLAIVPDVPGAGAHKVDKPRRRG